MRGRKILSVVRRVGGTEPRRAAERMDRRGGREGGGETVATLKAAAS